MPEFDQIKLAGQQILVSQDVGDVYAQAVILLVVLVVKEVLDLIAGNASEKSRDRTVAKDSHAVRVERMTPRIVWEILSGFVFVHDQVGRKIEDQAGLVVKGLFEKFVDVVLANYGREGNVRANAQHIAALRKRL